MAKKPAAPKAAPAPVVETIEKPLQTSPEWPDYIASRFVEGETDSDGNPFIHGLRRVAEQELDPIIYSVSTVVETPKESNLQRATVQHRIKIDFSASNMLLGSDIREFGDAADVYSGNTDADFAQYPVATAATRAEGRALRKALKLKKTTAEEISSVPAAEAGIDGLITLSQKRLIEKLCKELFIDVDKFIKIGQFAYDNIAQVRYDSAKGMIQHLNTYYQDNDLIPSSIKVESKKE